MALSGGPGLAGAHRGRGPAATHHRADRGPRPAARLGRRRRNRTGASRRVGMRCRRRCFACRWVTTGGPEAAARAARYAALDGLPRRAGAVGAHARRSSRDGAAGPGPRFGSALDRRHASLRSAVVPAVAGGAARRDPRRMPGAGPDRVAGPAQHRPPLHPDPAAPRGAAAAGRRAGRRGGRGAGPHRDGVARGHRADRHAGRPGAARRHGGVRAASTGPWRRCPIRCDAG